VPQPHPKSIGSGGTPGAQNWGHIRTARAAGARVRRGL
jgi:hypothetical protein